MRIIIAGGDEVAFRLAERLMTDHEVYLVAEEGAHDAPRVARLDVRSVQGRITAASTLREAGVEDCDYFVACSPVDERNLVACVTARNLGAHRTACFVFNPDFEQAGEEEDPITRALGIDFVVRPAQLLAQEIRRIIAIPGALDVELFAGGRVYLLRHAVEEGALIARAPLKEIGVPEGIVLVMARRGEEVFIPRGDTRFVVGDKLTVMGTLAGMNRLLFTYLRPGDAEPLSHEAVVVGGGSVGVAVTLGLEEADWRVKIIESDRNRCEAIAPLVQGLVLHGDGTDIDLLESERVRDAPVLIAVTSNDEKNLLVSLLAKSLNVRRIVTRADLPSNERLFERVGIDVVRSARGAAINGILSRIQASPPELLAEVEHGLAEVIEILLPEDLPAIPLLRMKAQLFGIIGAILRQGKVLIPRGGDAVEGGDRLLVFCKTEEEAAVREFFRHRLRDLAPRKG